VVRFALGFLYLAALVLLCVSVAAGASAQGDECKRWREAFAAMPVRMVTVQAGAKTMAIRVKVAETSEQAAAGCDRRYRLSAHGLEAVD